MSLHVCSPSPLRGRGAALLLTGLAVAVGAGALSPVRADVPPAGETVDLRGGADLRLDGAAAGDATGSGLAGAGDVNGDGIDDVIVGAWFADSNGRRDSGAAYVVYGSAAGARTTPFDLAGITGGATGFRIDGAAAGDRAGVSVGAAGDVNGDGIDDVVVGADAADANGRSGSGSAYIVYGTTSSNARTAPVDLATLTAGADGFRVDGAVAGDLAGYAVGGAGDVNSDGIDDVVLGAWMADPNARNGAGSVFVVYGSTVPRTAPLDLASLAPSSGFRIDGAAAGATTGFYSVGGAGDVNSDGIDDLVLGSPRLRNNAGVQSGSAYVVYGTTRSAARSVPLDLAALTSADGFRMDGAARSDTGWAVAGAGDVDGDGVDDVVVGAWTAANNGRAGSGSAYVVHGTPAGSPRSTPLDLAALAPADGFRIDGAAAADGAGISVDGAGDVNGDGLDDVVLLAGGADNNGRASSGSAYVVLGSTTARTAPLDLATITTTNAAAGFRIDGAAASDQVGDEFLGTVSGVGDLDADGAVEVGVSAPGADDNGRTGSGSVYLVEGSRPGTPPVVPGTPGPAPVPTTGAVPTVAVSQARSCDPVTGEVAVVVTTTDPDTPAAELVVTAASTSAAVVVAPEVSRRGAGTHVVRLAPASAGSATVVISVRDAASSASARVRVVVGTDRADDLRATGATDVLFGAGGDDTLTGGAGIDLLCGGAGRDRLTGGGGDDVLRGGGGDDVLRGGRGDDVLRAGAGDDVLRAGAGRDVLRGGRGSDLLVAGAGADSLKGGPGPDRLAGGPGRDVVIARTPGDTEIS